MRAKYLTAGSGSEPHPPPAMEAQASPVAAGSAPLYEMVSDGRSDWHNIHDAAICFCTNESLGIGTRIKDTPTAVPRPMTAEERQKLFDLAMSLGQK